jgi:hypothetical protein
MLASAFVRGRIHTLEQNLQPASSCTFYISAEHFLARNLYLFLPQQCLEEAGAFTGAPGAAGIVPDVCLAGAFTGAPGAAGIVPDVCLAGAFTGAPGAAGIVPDVCLAGVVSAMGEDGCAVVV